MSRNAFAQCASELEEREDCRHDCAAERLLRKKKLMELATHEAEEREAELLAMYAKKQGERK